MQVLVPYPQPILVARCLDPRRLWKQILECRELLKTDCSWRNHPVYKMYLPCHDWLQLYMECLVSFREGNETDALRFSTQADTIKPSFLVDGLCLAHRKRLYTKDPIYYSCFSEVGTSMINVYWSWEKQDWIYYENGKRKN